MSKRDDSKDRELGETLAKIADYAVTWRAGADARLHRPLEDYPDMRARFDAALPETGAPISDVIAELIAKSEPGLAAMVGPRFYGWVIGATEPAGMAADWLTSAWGQNAGTHTAAPAAAAAEERAAHWLLELMDLPRESSMGFVTGGTMANFVGLAAARGEVLRRAGWDCEADGLFGAPPITVVVGADAHSTVFAALKYLGLGAKRVVRVATDGQGAILAGAFVETMSKLSGPIIAIAQAGQINTGAFDPFTEIASAAHKAGAWLHVDGAFGLWARAAPDRAYLARGIEHCDSWAVDGHKWLQTPHDCGYAIVRDAAAHRRAMQIVASYLPEPDGARAPWDYTPELSRRARGFATWAMIRALGRNGVAELVSRHCALARRFAERLARDPDVEILNDVVLNQVAARLGPGLPDKAADDLTRRTIARIQDDGVCFAGGSEWRGKWILRLSISSAATDESDIDRSADAILSAWHAVKAAHRAD